MFGSNVSRAAIAAVAIACLVPASQALGPGSRRAEQQPWFAGDEDDGYEANASGGLDLQSDDAHAVVAAFARRSYPPGESALLKFWRGYPAVRVEILHAGPERALTIGAETINGIRVGRSVRIAPGRRTVRIAVGEWKSGLYAARLTTAGRVGYAPFIVRPRRLGTSRVAVVQPTNTWAAYNFADADGDGWGDSWYVSGRHRSVDMQRPFLDFGVPFRFRDWDLEFISWLDRTGKHVDFLSDDDVERLSGAELARRYDLIVFPGHEEYVTKTAYDAIERF